MVLEADLDSAWGRHSGFAERTCTAAACGDVLPKNHLALETVPLACMHCCELMLSSCGACAGGCTRAHRRRHHPLP